MVRKTIAAKIGVYQQKNSCAKCPNDVRYMFIHPFNSQGGKGDSKYMS